MFLSHLYVLKRVSDKRHDLILAYLFQVRHEILPLIEAAPAEVRAQAGHGSQ